MPTRKKSTRKSTGKRLRFEIFARDQFKCRYCGRDSSEVKLVVDHIKPVADGGPTIPENLITSCDPCNQGKGAKTLERHLPSEMDRLAREQELREQEAALKVATDSIALRAQIRHRIETHIKTLFGEIYIPKQTLSTFASFFSQHGEVLFEWIEIASYRGVKPGDVGPYVGGIRRQWLAQNNNTIAM